MTNRRELEATAKLRLNIGCGDWPLLFWTNLDADPQKPADIHMVVPPLPAASDSLLEIYAGHFLEHLGPDEARFFLRECFRCLRPGGRLGIVVPDTREILRRYLSGFPDAIEYPRGEWNDITDLDTVCALFLYSTAQDSPHKWSYDRHTLSRYVIEAGFVNITEIDRYRDPRIAQGAWYQFGFDAFKAAG